MLKACQAGPDPAESYAPHIGNCSARTWAADLAAPALHAGFPPTRSSLGDECVGENPRYNAGAARSAGQVRACSRVSHIAPVGARPSNGANMPMPICNCSRVYAIRRNAGCSYCRCLSVCVAPHAGHCATCDDLECAREDHWEMTWTGLWSVNATRRTRGDLCRFTLVAMFFYRCVVSRLY